MKLKSFGRLTELEEASAMWQLWLSGLIGIWLFFSPWVYNYSNNTGALWNSIIFGIILLILAIWAGVDSKNKRQS